MVIYEPFNALRVLTVVQSLIRDDLNINKLFIHWNTYIFIIYVVLLLLIDIIV